MTRGSLRSKHFHSAKSKERGFQRFAREKNGARAKNRKEGVGEGSEGKPLDFENLRSPATGARDWLG